LVPVYDEQNGLRVARTSNGLDTITESSLKYAKQIETNAKELKIFDDAIERTYNASTDPEPYTIADQMIEEMKENLDALIERIAHIVQTYEESRYKNSISIKINDAGVVDGYRIKEGLILAIVVGLFVCAWYGIQGVIKSKEKKV